MGTISESFDQHVITGTTSTSVTISITEMGLIVIPTSTGVACGLAISNKVLLEMFLQKLKKSYKKAHQVINTLTTNIGRVCKIK